MHNSFICFFVCRHPLALPTTSKSVWFRTPVAEKIQGQRLELCDCEGQMTSCNTLSQIFHILPPTRRTSPRNISNLLVILCFLTFSSYVASATTRYAQARHGCAGFYIKQKEILLASIFQCAQLLQVQFNVHRSNVRRPSSQHFIYCLWTVLHQSTQVEIHIPAWICNRSMGEWCCATSATHANNRPYCCPLHTAANARPTEVSPVQLIHFYPAV